MSIHRSLAVIGKLRRHRNVLKKSERLERLLSDGKPEGEIAIFGLPKLRNIMLKAKPKPKKEAAAEGAAPAEGAVAGAPAAAGAKGVTPSAKAPAAAAGAKTAAPAAAGAKGATAKAEAPKTGKKT
ncbi:MAG: small basic protein [Planctomycetes bacterium]|nr:small basic protein [Planctomycetota bacterium]